MKKFYIKLFPKVLADAEKKYEDYSFEGPKSLCCNIVFGEMYVEPADTCKVINYDTNETSTVEYKARKWNGKEKYHLNAIVKDKDDNDKY